MQTILNRMYSKLLKSPLEILEAQKMTMDVYSNLHNFDYAKLRSRYKSDAKSVYIGTFSDDELKASLCVTHLCPSTNLLPSEILFGFKRPPEISKNSVEIGQLSRKPYSSVGYHTELLHLLHGVSVYAKKSQVRFWTATLHPHLAKILKDIGFPFHVAHYGMPIVSDVNASLLECMGSYTSQGLVYAWYPMLDSISELQTINKKGKLLLC